MRSVNWGHEHVLPANEVSCKRSADVSMTTFKVKLLTKTSLQATFMFMNKTMLTCHLQHSLITGTMYSTCFIS